MRYVQAPDGEVLVDIRSKLPGRGAYTCPDRSCLEQAVKKRQFDRAFRGPCRLASYTELLEKLQAALVVRLESLLGMARKSGQVIGGSNMVLDALDKQGKVKLVLLAEDISSGIAEKIMRKTAAQGIQTVSLFRKAELGRLMGRSDRSVLALPEGQLTEAFQHVWQRYQDVLGEN